MTNNVIGIPTVRVVRNKIVLAFESTRLRTVHRGPEHPHDSRQGRQERAGISTPSWWRACSAKSDSRVELLHEHRWRALLPRTLGIKIEQSAGGLVPGWPRVCHKARLGNAGTHEAVALGPRAVCIPCSKSPTRQAP